MTTESAWIEKYRAAMLETDWAKVWALIQPAESAIRERQRTLILDRSGSMAEKDEMAHALSGLKSLRGDVLHWKDRRESPHS